jgi:glucose/mannose-6-phosphate isomerase
MTDLDNPETYMKLDPGDMRGRIRELPHECVAAWQQALDFELPADYADVNRVVILGMGGSAIGGDLLRGLNAPNGKVAVTVNRDYDPPGLDASTLVIASSYSGNTEETLSAFAQALPTPAKKLALTTGGRLKALAEVNGVPVFTITYEAQPRAALAHSFFPLLAICQNLGLVGDTRSDVEEVAGTLEGLQATLDDRSPTAANPAKQLAIKLMGRLTIIYGAGLLSAVAQRWKTQIN